MAAKKPKAKKPKPKAPKKEAKPKPPEKPKLEAVILSYRRGRHTQRTNQFLLEVPGCTTRAKAAQYIGKKVVWTAPGAARKQIFGKITQPHGRSGVLRARFTKGLPGTALTKKVKVL